MLKLGVSYYPELVDEAEWPRDLEGMRRGGLTVLRILEFAWSAVEPREGGHRFDWLDRFLDLAHGRGFEVVLGTPTASPPPWLVQQYPQMQVELRNGDRLPFGERRSCCVNSPIYRHFSVQIARRLGERYGRHPAVIGWQIDNELIGPESDRFECHCPECHWRFRDWLKQRYATVEDLNRAWWSHGFWSLQFGAWGEIPTPRCHRAAQGHQQDFFRFYNDSLVAYLKLQFDALRAVVAPGQFVSHNSTGVFDRTINHRDLARVLDETGWDAYRGAAANVHPAKEPFAGLAHEMFRSALRKPFWIFETDPFAPRVPAGRRPQTPAFLAEMRARGAKAVVFWHWRRHRGNLEVTNATFTDYGGEVGEDQLEALRRFRDRLAGDAPLPARLPPQPAAILFSADCVRAEHRNPQRPLPYLHALVSLYRPFWQHGVAMDVVNPGDDLADCRLLALPSWRHMDAADAEPIRAFVRRGGVLVATAKTAHRDAHGVCYGERAHPLADVFGFTVADDERQTHAPAVRLEDGRTFASEAYYEWVTPVTARVLGTFADGDAAGRPAVLRHDFGSGTVFYVAGSSLALNQVVARWAAERAGLRWWDNPHEDVTIVPHLVRPNAWWLINHGDGPRAVAGVEVPAGDFCIVEKPA